MITASIVTHCTAPNVLKNALDCVYSSSISKCWVIDNSPNDYLKTVAINGGAQYLHVDNNGFGAGHNLAIREILNLDVDYHIVMNADVSWEGDVAEILKNYMDDNPQVGMCMPRVVYPDGVLQYACRMLPTPYDVFGKRFLPKKLMKKRLERYLLANIDHNKPFNVPYLLGSFMFLRCDALKKEGLFDERFFMYPEDIDLTRRIHRNWKTMFIPIVTITHVHEAASRKSYKMLKIHILNMIRYFNKWGWFIDKERRKFNKRLLSDAPKGGDEIGRG